MPLDTGGLNELDREADEGQARMNDDAPSIQSGGDVGQALRALRLHKGLPLEALSEITRVRSSYLEAIEEMRLDQLPARPFVIGYIRAYAQALGADADQAVARFKAEEPVLDEPLAAPVGVTEERDPRLAAIVAAAAVIIVAIVAWNVIQRVMTESAPAPPTASDTAAQKALANTTAGPVALGAPLPAPVESTTPPPYETPGLSKAVNAEGQPLAPPTVAPPPQEFALAGTFTPKGTIYGAPAGQAAVVLQALKPAFLVIHGADGSVYFARQLAEGEAYRAANIAGLTVDVSEPEAFQVFSGGQSRGVLPTPVTQVAKLVGPAAPAPGAPAAAKPVTAAAPKAAVPSAAANLATKPASAAAAPGKPTAKPTTAKAASAKAPTAKTAAPKTAKPKAAAAKSAPPADATSDDSPPF